MAKSKSKGIFIAIILVVVGALFLSKPIKAMVAKVSNKPATSDEDESN